MQDVRISTNVTLGSFVFMNTGSKVCHDGKLGNYVTLSPDVTLAGNVIVGDNTEIGMGANVIQGITIGTNTVIGAGILDSLQVVNLIAELEDALDIDIDAAYVVEDNFKTKEAIIAMIEMII